jgi:hypothetical protein
VAISRPEHSTLSYSRPDLSYLGLGEPVTSSYLRPEVTYSRVDPPLPTSTYPRQESYSRHDTATTAAYSRPVVDSAVVGSSPYSRLEPEMNSGLYSSKSNLSYSRTDLSYTRPDYSDYSKPEVS